MTHTVQTHATCTVLEIHTSLLLCYIQHSWRAETPWQLLWQNSWGGVGGGGQCVCVCVLRWRSLKWKRRYLYVKMALIRQTSPRNRTRWTNRLCLVVSKLHMKCASPHYIHFRKNILINSTQYTHTIIGNINTQSLNVVVTLALGLKGNYATIHMELKSLEMKTLFCTCTGMYSNKRHQAKCTISVFCKY